MKKHYDQHLFGSAIALIDYGSEAFRQKMHKHFQSNPNSCVHWENVEKMPERKRSEGILLFREPLG